MAYEAAFSVVIDDPDSSHLETLIRGMVAAVNRTSADGRRIVDWKINGTRGIPECVEDSIVNGTYVAGEAFSDQASGVINIKMFDVEDYKRDPAKYQRFTRAVVTKPFSSLHTPSGRPLGAPFGAAVAIEFVTVTTLHVPVYRVRKASDRPDTSDWAYVYGDFLGNFS
jgi:hypothetical protein